MKKRTPRIEIKVVTDAGTVEYTHRKGDPCPDGTASPGPSADDFARAQKLVLEFAGILPLPVPPDDADPSEQWEGIGDHQARCRGCGFVVFVGADATIEAHANACQWPR